MIKWIFTIVSQNNNQTNELYHEYMATTPTTDISISHIIRWINHRTPNVIDEDIIYRLSALSIRKE
jgi:hypothetical protein